MTWLLLLSALVWVAVAVPTALLLARGIRMADLHRAAGTEAQARNLDLVATDVPAAEAELPWTGPATVPFPPPAAKQRQRPEIVRHPLRAADRDPSAHDSGLL